MELSKRDMAILTNLRQDARITLTRLSKKTGIPISTIFERLKVFVNSGLVKFIAFADFARLGFVTRVLVAVKVDRRKRDEVRNYLVKHLNMNNVQRINNGFTFLAEAIFAHMEEAEDFVEDLESRFKIRKMRVFHILGDISRERFLTDKSKTEVILNGNV